MKHQSVTIINDKRSHWVNAPLVQALDGMQTLRSRKTDFLGESFQKVQILITPFLFDLRFTRRSWNRS